MLHLKFKNLAAAAILLLVAACGPKYNEDADLTLEGDISIDGSSTVYPITEAVAEEFRYAAPNVRTTIGVSGSGGGFKKFSRGEIDISNASRSIKEDEAKAARANGLDFIELSVAYDGLTIVVNPKNDWVKDITVAELKKMWEPAAQNKIKRWNQIRPEWPNREIHLYGAGVESGTYDYFTEAIVGTSHASRGDFTASEDDNVLVQGVAGDINALGFFGYAYYEENKDKLKAIPVDDEDASNGAGPILPSLETIKDGSYAPLSRALFLYVNSPAVKKPQVVEFMDFYFENVGQLSQEIGFIPLPDEKYKAEHQKFKDFVAKHTGKATTQRKPDSTNTSH
ncbi:PstS family phosphate ABC transporter substrate-binding protein [Pontibacter sp. BT310]|uniref:Phosphate-binding protein n=1 Tax=Pontibacter populi TaxID=890055 RepID=A0ABS6X878_9BACT|nr:MULTISPECIES: PstS family phosphate ABC transporter substrate-binding protein [Pontibacter]MBJ6117339.1 PstS family phosphate ABC transporter substrate-binding protein [Pontibacter sp. BT310]MBR0569764.1 PstS family phosphate ABC transporter substrate-binding protein [Microvirga sp. STS03]MBW3364192.1 PstS family phosphate ABC transporter substrate-binding protein [Pontibacter populi]